MTSGDAILYLGVLVGASLAIVGGIGLAVAVLLEVFRRHLDDDR